MNIIERIIWFSMLATMFVVIAVVQIQKKNEEDQSITKEHPSLITVEIGNGFRLYKNLEKEPLLISKITKNQRASAGIKVESMDKGYYEYKSSISETIYRSNNGWEYYKSPYWNPEVDAKVMGNVSRIYFKEKEDKIIQITLNDTSGGKYDKDIENLIGAISLHGGAFGED